MSQLQCKVRHWNDNGTENGTNDRTRPSLRTDGHVFVVLTFELSGGSLAGRPLERMVSHRFHRPAEDFLFNALDANWRDDHRIAFAVVLDKVCGIKFTENALSKHREVAVLRPSIEIFREYSDIY